MRTISTEEFDRYERRVKWLMVFAILVMTHSCITGCAHTPPAPLPRVNYCAHAGKDHRPEDAEVRRLLCVRQGPTHLPADGAALYAD